ncbi:MAG: DUF4390 domain-containing protein [Sterolibacterium sp.]|nr:DUF4390 domain-containing protein [Sterolibacterium sp.]
MSRHGRRWLVILLLGIAGPGGLAPAWAGSIEATAARLIPNEENYVLSAEFNIDLGPRLEEIVTRGVPLYFQLELEITRDRWFWPGEHIAGRTLNYRLAYVPLSRQYRLSGASGLSQDFAKLADALRFMGRTAALPVAERSALKPGETYQAALRLALDRQQLPKPLQLDAIVNKEWTVDAKILRWQFVASNAGEREAH